MRDLKPEHTYAYALARDGSLNRGSDLLGEGTKPEICLVVQMENIVILDVLRNNECMPLHERGNVKEGIEILVLSYLV